MICKSQREKKVIPKRNGFRKEAIEAKEGTWELGREEANGNKPGARGGRERQGHAPRRRVKQKCSVHLSSLSHKTQE